MPRGLRHTDYLMLIAVVFAALAVVYGTTDLLMITVEPSFDCNLAESRVEKSICASKILRSLDNRMLRDYRRLQSRASGSDRVQLRTQQLSWLHSRDTGCFTGDPTCLERAYRARLDELERQLAGTHTDPAP